MASPYADPSLRTPKANEVWRAPSAKTRGGFRYVKISSTERKSTWES